MSQRRSTEDRLLDAAVQVLTRVGFHRVSLRQIAREAESSHSTALTIFGSKDRLLEAAVRREFSDLNDTVPTEPCGDLREDLIRLVKRYHDFYTARPFLLLALPDIIRAPNLLPIVQAEQKRTSAKLMELFAYYQVQGDWAEPVQATVVTELSHKLVSFLGAIYAQMLWSLGEITKAEFDAEEYVDLFLGGWGKAGE